MFMASDFSCSAELHLKDVRASITSGGLSSSGLLSGRIPAPRWLVFIMAQPEPAAGNILGFVLTLSIRGSERRITIRTTFLLKHHFPSNMGLTTITQQQKSIKAAASPCRSFTRSESPASKLHPAAEGVELAATKVTDYTVWR